MEDDEPPGVIRYCLENSSTSPSEKDDRECQKNRSGADGKLLYVVGNTCITHDGEDQPPPLPTVRDNMFPPPSIINIDDRR